MKLGERSGIHVLHRSATYFLRTGTLQIRFPCLVTSRRGRLFIVFLDVEKEHGLGICGRMEWTGKLNEGSEGGEEAGV